MAFVETKIKIEDKLLKNINTIAEKENTTKDKVINDMIKKGIKTKTKIPGYLIANKNRNPDPEGFNKLIGSIKTDKPVDVNKIIKEVRRGDI